MMRICKEIFQNIGCLNSIEAYIPLDENEREREKKKAEKKNLVQGEREKNKFCIGSRLFSVRSWK
jgi:hypothetical protein